MDNRGRDGWMQILLRLNRYEFEQTLGNSEGQGSPESMGSQRVRHDLTTEQQLCLGSLFCSLDGHVSS